MFFRGMVLGESALGELDLGEWAFGEGLRGMFFFAGGASLGCFEGMFCWRRLFGRRFVGG